jgi:hypothetical protein
MAFVRWNVDSHVYVIGTRNNGVDEIMCCGCRLKDPPQYFNTVSDSIAHFKEHEVAGHKVPQRLYDQLVELDEPFDWDVGV